jgi:type VI protein secretion system component VasK
MDLMRQAWMDRFKLAKAEARLAVKSALLIVVLTCAFCMVWVVAWIIAMVAVGYFALSQGLHWLAVTGILLLIQAAVGFLLTWQIRRLSRWLTFPATRESFSMSSLPLGDEELNRAEAEG